MANVFPSTLSFFRGFSNTSQVQVVTITGKDVWVTVSDPPPGGEFSWKGSPSGGWLLNPPTPPSSSSSSGTVAGPGSYEPPISIPVTFVPSSPAPVHATMTVNIVRNDAIRSAVPGFPTDVTLEGNADGVGPGALKIVQVDANPPGPDLAGEFVEIVNVTDATLDLQGCRVGDVRTHRGPRELFEFATPFTLAPMRGTAARRFLRIFTGPGVPANSGFIQIALNRGSPVWNNAGDTAWIRNPNGQLVDTFVYPVNGAAAPVTPAPEVNARVSVAPGAGLVATGIPVEEGDVLTFSSSGQIWVGVGISGGESGPDGKGSEPAGIGWPAPDAAPISLVGTIGSSGRFFWVGSASTLVVDDAEGELFLGVNDINLGDNWGSGYTCFVKRTRPK